MKKWLLRVVVAVVVLLLAAFWQLFFSDRPPLTIHPATLAGDGSLIDYCELPELDGRLDGTVGSTRFPLKPFS